MLILIERWLNIMALIIIQVNDGSQQIALNNFLFKRLNLILESEDNEKKQYRYKFGKKIYKSFNNAGRKKSYTNEDVEKAKRLRNQGLSYAKIAKELNLSETTIKRMLQD